MAEPGTRAANAAGYESRGKRRPKGARHPGLAVRYASAASETTAASMIVRGRGVEQSAFDAFEAPGREDVRHRDRGAVNAACERRRGDGQAHRNDGPCPIATRWTLAELRVGRLKTRDESRSAGTSITQRSSLHQHPGSPRVSSFIKAQRPFISSKSRSRNATRSPCSSASGGILPPRLGSPTPDNKAPARPGATSKALTLPALGA